MWTKRRHRCERTVVGKPGQGQGLISNRVVGATGQRLGSAGDPAADKGGSPRTAGLSHQIHFWDIQCCLEVGEEVGVFRSGRG